MKIGPTTSQTVHAAKALVDRVFPQQLPTERLLFWACSEETSQRCASDWLWLASPTSATSGLRSTTKGQYSEPSACTEIARTSPGMATAVTTKRPGLREHLWIGAPESHVHPLNNPPPTGLRKGPSTR